MATMVYLIAAPVFLASIAAHIYVKIRLKPGQDSDFDDYYHEFEDQHAGFARYTKWCRVTFTAAVISALLLFVAAVF